MLLNLRIHIFEMKFHGAENFFFIFFIANDDDTLDSGLKAGVGGPSSAAPDDFFTPH